MPTGPEEERLRDYVRYRRVQMGYPTQKALADATGLSARVILKIEAAESVRGSSLAAVELALGWLPGSAERIKKGGEPVLTDDETDPRPRIVRENWDDVHVQRIWAFRISEARRLALVKVYVAGREAQDTQAHGEEAL